jgi:hypothetical protein
MANLGGPNMPATLIHPSYAELVDLVGRPLPVVVGDASTVSLWLECVSTPVVFDGHCSFHVRLTGPVGAELPSGDHVLRSDGGDFQLDLEQVGRDVRYLHYEAHRIEASTTL